MTATNQTVTPPYLQAMNRDQLIQEVLRHKAAWDVVEDAALGIIQFADGLTFITESLDEAYPCDSNRHIEAPGLAVASIFTDFRSRAEEILANSLG